MNSVCGIFEGTQKSDEIPDQVLQEENQQQIR
jgi:hypothetical protein